MQCLCKHLEFYVQLTGKILVRNLEVKRKSDSEQVERYCVWLTKSRNNSKSIWPLLLIIFFLVLWSICVLLQKKVIFHQNTMFSTNKKKKKSSLVLYFFPHWISKMGCKWHQISCCLKTASHQLLSMSCSFSQNMDQ